MPERPEPRPIVLASAHRFDELRREIRHGDLIRVRRGAYVESGTEVLDHWDRREMELREFCAAVAAPSTCTFAFSHETAAALWHLEAPAIERVEIVQTFRPCAGMAGDLVRHYRPDLSEADIAWRFGLPVTPVERTAVDCALLSSPPAALAIADAALRRLARVTRFDREGSIARQTVVRQRLLAQLAERGPVRHARRARVVLTSADGLAERGGESWLRWLALVQGLPVPQLQIPVPVDGKTFYTDQWWPSTTTGAPTPIVAEYDGVEKYTDNAAEVVIDQTHREQLLVDATGATFLRFTKHDRRRPNAAARRLLRAFPAEIERMPRPLLYPRPPHRRRG